MPLDDLREYGSEISASSASGEAEDDADFPQGNAERNALSVLATLSASCSEDSGDDGSEAQQFDEQSENSADDESEHTPAQKSKRQYLVSESDDEECAEETDEDMQASRAEKSGIRRPRVEWQHVSSWNREQVSQDDYEGEIARILAKSLRDSRYVGTLKYNSRAISYF